MSWHTPSPTGPTPQTTYNRICLATPAGSNLSAYDLLFFARKVVTESIHFSKSLWVRRAVGSLLKIQHFQLLGTPIWGQDPSPPLWSRWRRGCQSLIGYPPQLPCACVQKEKEISITEYHSHFRFIALIPFPLQNTSSRPSVHSQNGLWIKLCPCHELRPDFVCRYQRLPPKEAPPF